MHFMKIILFSLLIITAAPRLFAEQGIPSIERSSSKE